MVHRIAQDRTDFARKRVGDHSLTLDQAAIAVARFLTRSAAIDENHIAASLLQVERDAHSHHSCAEDDDIGPDRHVDRSPLSAARPRERADPTSLTITAEIV